MKKTLFFLGALVLVGAGCTSSTPATPSRTTPGTETESNTGLKEADRTTDQRTGDTSGRASAESSLGIALPPDTGILSAINNAQSASVSGRTALTVSGTSAFLTAEMAKAGYQIGRSWGVSPLDNATNQSATFRGKDENWSINVRADGDMTSFDITRQL